LPAEGGSQYLTGNRKQETGKHVNIFTTLSLRGVYDEVISIKLVRKTMRLPACMKHGGQAINKFTILPITNSPIHHLKSTP
jgi:hypothetical protein